MAKGASFSYRGTYIYAPSKKTLKTFYSLFICLNARRRLFVRIIYMNIGINAHEPCMSSGPLVFITGLFLSFLISIIWTINSSHSEYIRKLLYMYLYFARGIFEDSIFNEVPTSVRYNIKKEVRVISINTLAWNILRQNIHVCYLPRQYI